MELGPLEKLIHEHTASLNDIYTQLGAPDGTVASKLAELEESLADTVKQQRKQAQNEVLRIREQLEHCAADIAALRKALGESSHASEPADLSLIPLLDHRNKVLLALRESQAQRKQQIDSLRSQLAAFAPALGPELTQAPADDSNLAQSAITHLQEQIRACQAEIKNRETLLQEQCAEILNLWTDLGISPAATEHMSELDSSILRFLGVSTAPAPALTPSSDTLKSLAAKRALLEQDRADREDLIQSLYDELYSLWTKMGVSDDEVDDFADTWKGIHDSSINAYKTELARMQELRTENLALFIAREREDIASLWDMLFYSDLERDYFSLMTTEEFSEEILEAHEQERNRLLKEQEERQPVLKLLNRYFELLGEMKQLEEAAKDPSRLTAKGQRGDPGRLLREEKLRKRVQKEQPKIEADLLHMLPQWETEHGKPFMVNGTRFYEELTARLEQEAHAKSSKRTRAGTASQSALRPQTTGSSTTSSASASSLKRQDTGNSVSSTATKRARSATTSTGTRLPLRNMHAPTTPCPTSSYAPSMLVPSTAASTSSAYHSSSREPVGRLRYNNTHSSSEADSQSLFSPAIVTMPKAKVKGFKPRPSALMMLPKKS